MFRKATRHGNLEVVKWLGDNNIVWDLNPSTTQKWDQNQICTPVGWTLCADAAWGGHAEALSYLSGKWCCPRAAAGGHLETLIWLRANGCPWESDPGHEITSDQISFTAGYAAKYGHMEVLQWLQANGHEWGDWTCAYAAEGKQLKILQWLHASGCPVDERTCAWAAVHGHIDVLVGICDGRRNRMRGVDVRVRPLLQRGI